MGLEADLDMLCFHGHSVHGWLTAESVWEHACVIVATIGVSGLMTKNGTALTVVQGNKAESITAHGSSTCKHPG